MSVSSGMKHCLEPPHSYLFSSTFCSLPSENRWDLCKPAWDKAGSTSLDNPSVPCELSLPGLAAQSEGMSHQYLICPACAWSSSALGQEAAAGSRDPPPTPPWGQGSATGTLWPFRAGLCWPKWGLQLCGMGSKAVALLEWECGGTCLG